MLRFWLVEQAGRLSLLAYQSRDRRARLSSVAAAIEGAVSVDRRSIAGPGMGKVDAGWRSCALG